MPTLQDMEKAKEFYLRLVGSISVLLGRLSKTRRLEDSDVEPLRQFAVELLAPLKSCPNAYMIYFCRGTVEDYLVAKLANVGVLSARLGVQMGLSDDDVRFLALAGWLHDIGMAALDRLDLQPRVLSSKEKAVLASHCEKAVSLLAPGMRDREMLAEVCYGHHERIDGSGYPRKLRDKTGPLFARIVAVAEQYEALSHARPYRPRMISHEAITRLIDQSRALFDDQVVKSLIKSLSVYPPGSYVQLNNNAVARVVGINEDMPTRPLVLPVFDANGRPMADAAFLDLSATPLVRISAAVDETALKLDPKILLELRVQRWWTLP